MHPIVLVLAILAALLALQALRSIRTDASNIRAASRRRLDELAARLAEDKDPEGASLVRGENPEGFVARFRHLLPRSKKLDTLLYRAGAPMSVRQFLISTLVLGGVGFFAGLTLFGGGPRALACMLTGSIPYLVLVQK